MKEAHLVVSPERRTLKLKVERQQWEGFLSPEKKRSTFGRGLTFQLN